MKDILLLTDFDGTITGQDFYKQILFRYEHKKLFKKFPKFMKREYTCLEFLGEVFKDMNLSEEELLDEIEKIPLDPYFNETVDILKEKNNDIIIVSAGCEYYIKQKLKDILEKIEIIAIKGEYKDRGLKFTIDKKYRYFSNETGIDKKKVILNYKGKYKKIIYAGDSIPDFEAAKEADIIFAKDKLEMMLKKENIKYNKFITYNDIKKHILENKFYSEE